jgi:hypothetical protein
LRTRGVIAFAHRTRLAKLIGEEGVFPGGGQGYG